MLKINKGKRRYGGARNANLGVAGQTRHIAGERVNVGACAAVKEDPHVFRKVLAVDDEHICAGAKGFRVAIAEGHAVFAGGDDFLGAQAKGLFGRAVVGPLHKAAVVRIVSAGHAILVAVVNDRNAGDGVIERVQKGQSLVAQGVTRLDIPGVACELAVFVRRNTSVRQGDEARLVLVA